MCWEQAGFFCWCHYLLRLVPAIKILCWLCGNRWLCSNCWLCRNLRVGADGPPKYSTPWLLWTPIIFLAQVISEICDYRIFLIEISLFIFRSAPHNVRNASTPNSGANSDYDADDSDNEDFSSEFHHVALQLLDLMHTLHTRAAQIHFSWAEEAEQSAGNDGTSWGANPNNNFVNTSR